MTTELQRGAQAAVEAQTSSRYELSLKNDFCDAAMAAVVAKQIVSEGYDLVLGHPCPKAALAAAKIYGASGVTFIATETRHPALTAKRAGPSVFRLSGRDDAQGPDAARILLEGRRFKTIAIVHDRTLYAKTIAEQAEAALKAVKQEVITATIIAGDKDYTKLIAKIKDAGAVFFAGFPMEAGFILKELRATGASALFLGSDSIATAEFPASFPEVAKDIYVLRSERESLSQHLDAAVTAVQLYARAKANAMGPSRHRAEFHALINATLGRYPAGVKFYGYPVVSQLGTTGIKELNAIAFDAAGNSIIESYRLVRWDGQSWYPEPSLNLLPPTK